MARRSKRGKRSKNAGGQQGPAINPTTSASNSTNTSVVPATEAPPDHHDRNSDNVTAGCPSLSLEFTHDVSEFIPGQNMASACPPPPLIQEEAERHEQSSIEATTVPEQSSAHPAAPSLDPLPTHQDAKPNPASGPSDPRHSSSDEPRSSLARANSTKDAGNWWAGPGADQDSRPPSVPVPVHESPANTTTQLQTTAYAEPPSDPVEMPPDKPAVEPPNKKNTKGMRYRMRRKLSFGNAVDVLETHAENASLSNNQQEEDQAASIYLAKGGIFSGSTDNISVSSTASSASMMLHKMRKGISAGQSLKRLFRKKYRTSTPAAEFSGVSFTTGMEHEDIDASSVEQPRCSTSCGKPECRPTVPRRGILKKSSHELLSSQAWLSHDAPSFVSSHDTPESSMPSTPRDVGLENNHYFLGVSRLANYSSKSLPNMPRNITFNDHIERGNAWSSAEYDRTGDIVTCNRLTPALARDIREELNAYKTNEMVVHELSKTHTQFH